MSTFLSNILSQRNTTHIIGADTNSSIGTCVSLPEANLSDKQESHLDIDPALSLLGPFGNPHRSKSRENLLNIMREHQLRAAATFFDNNNKYNTWLAPTHPSTGKRQAYQLDHIFIPKYQLCHTKNIKPKFNSTTSNHAALLIDFQLSSTPLLKKKEEKSDNPMPPAKKIDNKVLRGREPPIKKKKVEEYFSNLSPENATLLSPSELLDDFESHIVQSAVDVASKETKRRPDWFTEAKQLPLDLIQQRNEAFKMCMKSPSEENQAK